MPVMRTTARILVVDDDPDLRFLARCIIEAELKAPTVVVNEAGSGEEALQHLDATAVDVMILDLHMPRMNGLAVLQGLAGRSNRPCVVAWSADRAALAQAAKTGAAFTVEKGQDADALVEAVHDCLALAG
jgi:DNA-binding NarL/FixJ family response regulator